MVAIRRLKTASADFWQQLEAVHAFDDGDDLTINNVVREILHDVRKRGDAALLDYTERFDHLTVANAAEFELPASRLQQALETIPAAEKTALEQAAQRLRDYHLKQKSESWHYTEDDGTLLGQKVTALDRVGLYVPGGKAAYPSSVLMNAIPAKVAGVDELIMVVPTPDGVINELVLAAAVIGGVNRVFTIGGAQAIAALAYGTDAVPAVDKIVGPGNIYVATAKRMVFGTVGIDMIAGPSEILVLADNSMPADWMAMDLFSQSEHDEDAQAILISTDAAYLEQVEESINRLLPGMERAAIIEASLTRRAAMIEAASMDDVMAVINYIAPEHLQLSVADPQSLLPGVRHAGAIFMGQSTAEVLGDYCAGPNHVLPTARTARFSSPLGVYDFQKRSSLIMCSPEGASELGKIASTLARGEGLTAHARSAEYRIKA